MHDDLHFVVEDNGPNMMKIEQLYGQLSYIFLKSFTHSSRLHSYFISSTNDITEAVALSEDL